MTNVKYTVKANTPQEMREEIVKWLNEQASWYGMTARTAKLQGSKKENHARAYAIEAAAKFISEVVIEPKDVPVFGQPIFNIGISGYLNEFEAYKERTVDEWLKRDRLIMAIKRRRMDTGEGLKEAKDYCERRREEMKSGIE